LIRLYDYLPSGNCYKARLLMHLLGVEFESIAVDFHPAREQRAVAFLEINPLGRVPVLEDGGLRLRDAQAILVYLARAYDASGLWYPLDAPTAGQVAMWLAFADELTSSASAARLHDGLFHPGDAASLRAQARRQFGVLDEHLWFAEREQQDWLATRQAPSIADIACFPYVMLSEEAGVSREDFPALRRWTDRVRRIPGFVGMPGIFTEDLAA
jgi:glutathione S-transferase